MLTRHVVAVALTEIVDVVVEEDVVVVEAVIVLVAETEEVMAGVPETIDVVVAV